jgi:hypothetical protein
MIGVEYDPRNAFSRGPGSPPGKEAIVSSSSSMTAPKVSEAMINKRYGQDILTSME